ncbi:hypothetical protein DNAM5_77 [Haloarcula californiae tailed virus 1]|uniref:Uncharacterized protein n=1 Tax=Haloarcula californiae tailed virus 1 TaxID=1273746 RepID=R4TNZ2_9CAUD|nr:hypothetical protein M202_gp140 [Haloarcula californiae tailed virus 1]AGM11938.1 hypothetical protein DNAM5_77 [Haloarcula californiae tailed virus 1]
MYYEVRRTEMSDSKFDAALETARNRTLMNHEVEEQIDVLVPQSDDDLSDLEEVLTSVLHPSHELLKTVVAEPDEDEVDGAKPRTSARTFVWNVSDDEDELAFRVVAEWENTYDDKRVTVESPPPWETPDDMTPANEVIKSLPWGDDECADDDDREGSHYTFDDDNRAAPPEAEDAWSLDAEYLDDLRELAESEGYDWVDARGDESSEADPMLEDLLDFVQDGDRIEVTYAKKNGNGLNTYSGEVTYFKRVHTSRSSGYDMSTGETWGVVFEDEGGKTKRVKENDEGKASMYSNGHYPYMGQVVKVTAGPSSADFDDAEMNVPDEGDADDSNEAENDESDDENESSANTDASPVEGQSAAENADDEDDDVWGVFA